MTRRPPARATVHARRVAAALYAPDGEIPEKPAREKARDLEGPVHLAILRWLRLVLPPDAVPFHIGNGEARDARDGVKLKEMGVLAGVPDLLILCAGRAIFIEVKAPPDIGKKGAPLAPRKPSRAQKETIAAIIGAGFPVAVVDSIDGARAFLRGLGVRLREVTT